MFSYRECRHNIVTSGVSVIRQSNYPSDFLISSTLSNEIHIVSTRTVKQVTSFLGLNPSVTINSFGDDLEKSIHGIPVILNCISYICFHVSSTIKSKQTYFYVTIFSSLCPLSHKRQ